MPLVSYNIPHLVNGVSQQPDALRLPTSCEEMINGWPSLVSGLSKRPPSEHINALSLQVDNDCAGHLITRSDNKQYFVLVSDRGIDVIDEDGLSQTVSYPNGKSYIDTVGNPSKSIKFLTVGDYTFIVNKDIRVKADEHGENPPDAGVFADFSYDKKNQFPATGAANKIYYAYDTNKFYKWEQTVLQPELKGWVNQGTTIASVLTTGTATQPGTPPQSLASPNASYKYVASLPDAKTVDANTKVYIASSPQKREDKQQRCTTVRGQTSCSMTTIGWYWDWKITLFKAEVTRPEILGSYEYVEYSRNQVLTEVRRLNPDTRATVYITSSVANSYYAIYINGVKKAQYLTPKGIDAASSVPDTTVIADALKDDLVASGYSAGVEGSSVKIFGLSVTDTVAVKGPNGDRAIKCYRDSIKSFNDLPPNDAEGRLVKVVSDPDSQGDDYYVVYRNGVWIEEEGWTEGARPDPMTMPHVLVRELSDEGTVSFVFRPHTWESRSSGDAKSNPHPTFVGQKINDIFVFGSRLGFVADENVILSEADNFENFYRTTCATLVESDRIDVALFNKDVDILRHVIPFNKDLVLMSSSSQYRMSFDQYISPKTVNVQYTTSYNNSPHIKPVNMGTSIYFIDDHRENKWAKVFEYYPRPNNTGDEADDVTAAIPEYIPSDMRYLAASPRMNAVVVGNGGPSMYVYKFFWDGDRKIQNAWGKWTFPDCSMIYYTCFLNNFLYMVCKRNGKVCLERIRFDEDVFTSAKNATAYIDRFVASIGLTMTYNSTTDRTTITVPYVSDVKPEVISSTEGVPAYRHPVISFTKNATTTTVVVAGNISEFEVKVGVPYTFEYEFSKQYLRRPGDKGERTILEGRVQLRYLSLEYHDTAYFQFHMKVVGRDEVTATYNGDIAGGDNSLVGSVNFGSGVQRIPLMGSSGDVRLRITNDSPFGNAFGSAEWQAIWTPRSQRIN